MANLDFPGILSGPHELVAPASPQTITAAWANLGAALYVAGASTTILYPNLDTNDSTNIRFRLLMQLTDTDAVVRLPPIRTVGASAVLVEPEYIEYNLDEDQAIPLGWQLDGAVPYVQFQVIAGALGVTAGIILSAYVTTALRSS